MSRRRLLMIIGIVVVVVVLVVVLDALLANHQPAIAGLAAPERVIPAGSCQIVCDATDGDGDKLSYNWSAKKRLRLVSFEDVFDRLLSLPRSSPERAFERQEVMKVVDDAIRSLSMPQRVVVVLFYLQGFSLVEIAHVLDCPVGTVKSRLHNARKGLRRRLIADSRITREMAYDLLSS